MHREQVDDALGEPNEEHLVVERLGGVGLLLLASRIVQEDEIEIGRVAELHATAACRNRQRRCAQRGERRPRHRTSGRRTAR